MDLIFPSDAFPPPPSLRLQVPDSWQAFRHADAVVAAADPEGSGEFTTNIVVTITRVLDGVSLAQVVELQLATTIDGLGGTLEGQQREEVAGREAVWSNVSYQGDPHPIPFFQVQVSLLVERTVDVADLVTVTASCAADLAEHHAPLFRAAVLSLAIGE